MKISICIPHYNRIEYLLKSLAFIEKQTYDNVEIVISDDNSSDDTEKEITEVKKTYKFPIIYHRNTNNLGYDRNLRQSIELATGDYCFVLGNDDTFYAPDDLSYLVSFLKKNNFPDVGFCNYIEEGNNKLYERAPFTSVFKGNQNIALKYYRSFSFVAGLIYKKAAFEEVNTGKFDGSIYVQIYLAIRIILSGGTFFMIKRPLVLKDIIIKDRVVNSYRDRLIKKWQDFKVEDGGLPSVINVVSTAFDDSGLSDKKIKNKIVKDIYTITYPYWILDYKYNGAFVHAVGLAKGLKPNRISVYANLPFFQKINIQLIYYFITFSAMLFPSKLFIQIKPTLYRWIKK